MQSLGSDSIRTKMALAHRGSAGCCAEACFPGQHDCLVTVLDANLVEDPCNMVSNGFFRNAKRCRQLRIVHAFGNSFEDRKLRGVSSSSGSSWVRAGSRARVLRESSGSHSRGAARLVVGKRHMIFTVDLDKARAGNEADKRPTFFDRHHLVTFGVQDKYGALDLARGIPDIHVPANLNHASRGFCGRRNALKVAPRMPMLNRALRLECMRPYLEQRIVCASRASKERPPHGSFGFDRWIVPQHSSSE